MVENVDVAAGWFELYADDVRLVESTLKTRSLAFVPLHAPSGRSC